MVGICLIVMVGLFLSGESNYFQINHLFGTMLP